MVKKLSRIGNSLGLVIERPILELLRIDESTTLEVSTDGESLIVRPVRKGKRERARESAQRMMDAHAKTFEKLAK